MPQRMSWSMVSPRRSTSTERGGWGSPARCDGGSGHRADGDEVLCASLETVRTEGIDGTIYTHRRPRAHTSTAVW